MLVKEKLFIIATEKQVSYLKKMLLINKYKENPY